MIGQAHTSSVQLDERVELHQLLFHLSRVGHLSDAAQRGPCCFTSRLAICFGPSRPATTTGNDGAVDHLVLSLSVIVFRVIWHRVSPMQPVGIDQLFAMDETEALALEPLLHRSNFLTWQPCLRARLSFSFSLSLSLTLTLTLTLTLILRSSLFALRSLPISSCVLSLSLLPSSHPSLFFFRSHRVPDRGRELSKTCEQQSAFVSVTADRKTMTCAVLIAQHDAKTSGLGRLSTIQYSPTGSSCIHRCAICTTDLPTGIF